MGRNLSGNLYSAAEIEILKRVWNVEGGTSTDCRLALASELRIERTRSAVCGFINRNRKLFNRREDLPSTKRTPRPRMADKPKFEGRGRQQNGYKPDHAVAYLRVPPAPKVRASFSDPTSYDAASLRLPIGALGCGQCRFPVNDAPDAAGHLFCGLPATRRSYCEHHAARAFGGYRAEETGEPRKQVARVGSFA